MAGRDRSSRPNEDPTRAGDSVNRRLAGGEAQRDPERLEMGGKRLHADSTLRQPNAGEPDEDGLNAEQHR